jgi:hypothetical protein
MSLKFSNYVNNGIVVEEQSLQDEYQEYFQGMLKKYKVSSPADLDEEELKKFFNDVSDGWIKGKGKK